MDIGGQSSYIVPATRGLYATTLLEDRNTTYPLKQNTVLNYT